MVYVIQLASRIRTELQFCPDPARKLSANLYDIYHCCVYSEKLLIMGQRNCPKHVEFYSKNKFEELVHLVGFIIRMHLITFQFLKYWLAAHRLMMFNFKLLPQRGLSFHFMASKFVKYQLYTRRFIIIY